MRTSAIILALLLPHTATARIDMNMKECLERYGPITKEKFIAEKQVETTHDKNGYEIKCSFQDGVCWKIQYTKLDGKPIGDKMISWLLKQEANEWKEVPVEHDRDPFAPKPEKKPKFKPKPEVRWVSITMEAYKSDTSDPFNPSAKKLYRFTMQRVKRWSD